MTRAKARARSQAAGSGAEDVAKCLATGRVEHGPGTDQVAGRVAGPEASPIDDRGQRTVVRQKLSGWRSPWVQTRGPV